MWVRRIARWVGKAAFQMLVDCGGWLGFAGSAYLPPDVDEQPEPPGDRAAVPLSASERAAWQDITRRLAASRVRD